MDKPVVTELIQDELNSKNLKFELDKLLEENNRKKILRDYDELRKKLGNSGASNRTAELITNFSKQNRS